MDRRTFVKTVTAAGTALAFSRPLTKSPDGLPVRLTVLHTNDTHSRIEPYPDNHNHYAGLGGVARRSELIRRIRDETPHVLLLDAGDAFHGTPYFDRFQGALDLQLMTRMRYDAMTLGEFDFVNGIAGFEKVMHHAGFYLLASNYHLGSLPLSTKVKPFIIRMVNGIKTGIFGLAAPFEPAEQGWVYRNSRVLDPLETASKMAEQLKKDHRCNLVICLSHLGYRADEPDRITDQVLARQIDGIDLIIGGHTHTFMEQPECISKENGDCTWISHAGHSGLTMGRLDLVFNKDQRISDLVYGSLNIGNHSVITSA